MMTNKQALIHATEKAGIKVQYYLDTHENSYLEEAKSYIMAAYILIKEMNNECGN